MNQFKVGGYYTLLDRTAFFQLEDIQAGRFEDLPTGTVLKVIAIQGSLVTLKKRGYKGAILYSRTWSRKKFKPATKKQISEYKYGYKKWWLR